MPTASLASSDMRLWSHGGSNTSSTSQLLTPSTPSTAFLTQIGISPATGQPGAVSVICTSTLAVVVDVDLVDQTELIDVGGDLGIVHRLQRHDDVAGQPVQLFFRECRALDGRAAFRQGWRLGMRHRLFEGRLFGTRRQGRIRLQMRTMPHIDDVAFLRGVRVLAAHREAVITLDIVVGHNLCNPCKRQPLYGFQAKKSCALMRASARASTSAFVLYIPNDARHVAVTPSRSINGCAQW